MSVVDALAQTLNSPYTICKKANSNFKKIIGLKIQPGWKRKVIKLIGGTNGCTHITELLSSCATAAFQTIYPYKAKQKENKKISASSKGINPRPQLLGTCHAFNPKSLVVKRLWPEWHEED